MRELRTVELDAVFGAGPDDGTTAVDAARNACEGLPDDTDVTIETSTGGNLNVGVGGTSTGTTITFETTCGELTDSGEDSQGEKSRE